MKILENSVFVLRKCEKNKENFQLQIQKIQKRTSLKKEVCEENIVCVFLFSRLDLNFEWSQIRGALESPETLDNQKPEDHGKSPSFR